MRNVHIVTVGFDPHPSIDMLASGDVDYIYLLNDRSEEQARISERSITSILDRIGSIGYEILEIDCYDYQNVHDTILKISDKEMASDKDCIIHINFSRGTAIAVGAACTAACAIKNADLYYSKWKQSEELDVSQRIIHVDVSEFNTIFQLRGATKDFFKLFKNASNGQITNSELRILSGLKKNSLTNHTGKLCDLNLITRDQNGRSVSWKLTESGKTVLKRILET